MSQRVSGYARKERDFYRTPAWCTEAVLDIAFSTDIKPMIWDPACGDGAMTDVFQKRGFDWIGTDVADGNDFLKLQCPPVMNKIGAVVANPPYRLAQGFIEKALEFMRPVQGIVAMLLRIDYDSAATRRHLFKDSPDFWMKLVLTRRIQWFDGGGNPSYNHAWYIWICQGQQEAPTIAYAP